MLVLGGPVRRSLRPGPAVPGRSMAVVHPILDYIARSACFTLPLRSMVAVVLPLFRGWGGRTTARTVAAFIGFRLQAHNLIVVQLHVPNVRKHRAPIPKHRQWPSPVGFRALKKRRSTRLNRPTPCTPRGAQGADLAAPLVGNGENGRRRRRCQFRGQIVIHTS